MVDPQVTLVRVLDQWEEWRPPFAEHVLGRFTTREEDPDNPGFPLPQRVEMTCETCGAIWRTWCSTGSVRVHITRFGAVHLHRDPFAQGNPSHAPDGTVHPKSGSGRKEPT